jgi:hypothetical protein
MGETPGMSDWYCISQNGPEVRVAFILSENRFWPPEIICESALPVADVSGRPVVLTGPGAVWMYAHAAATLRAAGASDICVQTPNRPGTSDDLTGSESLLILAGEDRQKGALLLVRLRASPPLSQMAVNRLLEPRLEELARLRPAELVLAGRASVEVYAQIARAAVDSGARRIVCWSARDGLVVVYDPDGGRLGSQIARPDWLAQAMPRPTWPVILGVTGDPNCGKSVFSAALDSYHEQIGCDGWKLDCDGQSPTPPWYLSLIGDERARQLREAQKRCWTPQMEATIAEQLRLGRELFSVLIADLPGGNHKVVPPQRLPEGRERIFAEVDALILLQRDDAPSETAWREALRPHGFDDRIAAVISSSHPDGPPSLSVCKEGGLWRGGVTGLDRSRSTRELVKAYRSGLDQLWPAMLKFARRRSARG